MRRFLASRWIFIVTCVAVFTPHLLHKPLPGQPIRIGLPRILNGDEPHYLLIINSVINDFDLDLSNNYASSHHGSTQAGIGFAGKPLNHQTFWMVDGRQLGWDKCFDPWKWLHDSSGAIAPFPISDRASQVAFLPEYSVHPAGMGFVLAPFLFPFRHSPNLIEPLSIVCTGAAAMLTFFFLCVLLRRFSATQFYADGVSAAIVLGSPLWHYGRVLYTEGYLALCAVASYAMAVRYKRYWPAGIAVGIGMFMKPFAVLLIIPLLIPLISKKEFSRALALALPVACASMAVLAMNKAMFGSFFMFSQPYGFGDIVTGTKNLWLSADRGIIATCPLAIVAVAAWPSFVKRFGTDALAIAGGFAMYFAVIASFSCWDGGDVYGPRLVLPVLPLLLISLAGIPKMRVWKSQWVRSLVILIAVISVVTNAFAAIFSWQFLIRSPLVAIIAKTCHL